MRVCTDAGRFMEGQCALIEILHNNCPSAQPRAWWPSTAQIGTKLVYLQSPEPVLYVVLLSHILGKFPLISAGYEGTIPGTCMAARMHSISLACVTITDPLALGSHPFYINPWAMIWPVDYKADAH